MGFNHYITFFSFKMLCKKYTYNVDHYVNTVNKIWIIFHVGHGTINVSNLMLHLTCHHCLMFVAKIQWGPSLWCVSV
jgi:hypothetical protein